MQRRGRDGAEPLGDAVDRETGRREVRAQQRDQGLVDDGGVVQDPSPVARTPPSLAASARVEGRVDLEDLVETGDGEDLEHAVVRSDEPHRAAARARELEPPDEDTEARRVEEGHVRQVDDELRAAALDLLVELLAHERRGVDVDLTAEVHHGPVAVVGSGDREIHLCPFLYPHVQAWSPDG